MVKAEITPLPSQSDLRAELQPLLDLRDLLLRMDSSFSLPNLHLQPRTRLPTRVIAYPPKAPTNNRASLISPQMLATRALPHSQAHSGARVSIQHVSYHSSRSKSEAPVGSYSWI